MVVPNRYPGANILAQRGHWDEATRQVVLDRVQNVPRVRHFKGQAPATLEALCSRVIPQDHRPPEARVALAPWIDQRCAATLPEGFQFEDLPSHRDAWDLGLQGLDQTAEALIGGQFADLAAGQQDVVLRSIRGGQPPGAIWQTLPAGRWWTYIALRDITGVYYAHPSAWDEIGFGGPAYPRGYFALNHGRPEPWEARERGEH